MKDMGASIVIMAVSGCGKSSQGAAVPHAQGLPLIEGDDHYSEQNRPAVTFPSFSGSIIQRLMNY
jgi:shikimate kinase